jgi:5-methylthioadenosine/S-adenosylhomocysteine deaminase
METSAPAVPFFDLLLLGAVALTADPARPEIRDSALGIRDGRIVWLDAQPPERYEAARTLRRVSSTSIRTAS